MGIELAKAFITVKADNSKLGPTLRQTQRQTGSAFRSIGLQMKSLLGAAAIQKSIQVITQSFREFIGLAERQANAEQRVAAVIKATGGAAGFTAKQLQKQAAALQKVTTVGDEEIMELQAILLTFKAVSGDAFERTTESALDLAAVIGTDAKSGALQLGKALEDPIRGITALRRAGVSFTEAEKKQIKTLQESNRLREAQEVVLRGVEGQIKGVARALSQTDAGRLKQVRNELDDMKETLGERLIPLSIQWQKIQMGILESLQPIVDLFNGLSLAVGEAGLSGAFKILGTVLIGLIGVWAAYVIALKAVAAAKIVVLSLSGPVGWLALTAAATAATVAIMSANQAIGAFEARAERARKKAEKDREAAEKDVTKKKQELKKSQDEAVTKRVEDRLKGMREELFRLTSGLTDAQIAWREFRLEGASQYYLIQFKTLRNEIDKTKARMEAATEFAEKQQEAAKRIQDRGKGLTESLRTPLERFKEEIAEINQLLHLGAITPETARRAGEQARGGLPQPDQMPTRVGFRDLGKQIQDQLLQRETVNLQKKEIKVEEEGNKKLDGILKAIIDKDREMVLS